MKHLIALLLTCSLAVAADFAVMLYPAGNSAGIPTNWPAKVQDWADTYSAPWIRMTPEQLTAQFQTATADYTAWESNKTATYAAAVGVNLTNYNTHLGVIKTNVTLGLSAITPAQFTNTVTRMARVILIQAALLKKLGAQIEDEQ